MPKASRLRTSLSRASYHWYRYVLVLCGPPHPTANTPPPPARGNPIRSNTPTTRHTLRPVPPPSCTHTPAPHPPQPLPPPPLQPTRDSRVSLRVPAEFGGCKDFSFLLRCTYCTVLTSTRTQRFFLWVPKIATVISTRCTVLISPRASLIIEDIYLILRETIQWHISYFR